MAITMQDVVVFLPTAFLSGLVGQFFREFGLTVVFAETNRAEIRVFLSDKKERRRSVGEVAGEVRRWKNEYPGIKMTVTEEQNTTVKDYGAPLQLTVTGPGDQVLAGLAARVEEIVKSTPGTVDVRSSWQAAGRPEVQVQADRLRAARQALSAGEIGTALRAALHGEEAGKFRKKGEEYPLRVRTRPPGEVEKAAAGRGRGKLLRLAGLLNPQVVLQSIDIQQNHLVSYRHRHNPVAMAGDNLPGAGVAL